MALFFLIGWAVLYLLIPRGASFHYEFQKGKPWPYSTLRAPFSYPIYKSETALKLDISQMQKSVRPVFRFDESVGRNLLPELASSARTAYSIYRDSLLSTTTKRGVNIPQNLFTHQDSARFVEVISYIYRMGIVRNESVLPYSHGGEFSVLRGRTLYEVWFDNVYSPRSAASLLSRELYVAASDPLRMDFWKDLDLSEHFSENLLYDSLLTANLRQSAIQKIPLAQGAVSQGEVIIEQGAIVGETEYAQLESLRKELRERHGGNARTNGWHEAGYALLLLVMLSLYILFLEEADRQVLKHNRKLLFLLLLQVSTIGAGLLMLRMAPDYIYMLPLAILPLLIRSFFSSRLAFTTFVFSVGTLALFIPDSYLFASLSLTAGVVAIFGIKSINRRSRLFESIGLIFLAYVVQYTILKLIFEGSITSINPRMYIHFVVNALLCLSTYLLMYPVERLFGFVSFATLMELSDTNRSLLRALAERAPGTFQHCLQVANLAEAAARHLNCDALLARTGALYHDIGKMQHPEYFTENQAPGENPHNALSDRESAEIILRHVTDGVVMARRHQLPEEIINFITTHHGTTRVEYFYREYKRKHPGEEVHPEWFTYPGPRPFSKEMAIVMMADSVEASSRSLPEYTHETIRLQVDGIITGHQAEDQYNEADLTLREINEIKELFIRKLENIYHSRIQYPKDPDESSR